MKFINRSDYPWLLKTLDEKLMRNFTARIRLTSPQSPLTDLNITNKRPHTLHLLV